MRTLTRGLPVLFVFILLFFVLPPATRADEIVITNGTLSSSLYTVDRFSFGNQAQGFNIAGFLNTTSGSFGYVCQPCRDGTISASRTFRTDELGFGTATVGGVTHERVYYTGHLSFSIPIFTIEDHSPTFTVEVPFTMTGNLMGSMRYGGQPPVIFSTTMLSGHGIASFVFSSSLHFHAGWLHDLQSVTLTFSPDPAPVPEPATLILFGTGLAAVAARYRRRRR